MILPDGVFAGMYVDYRGNDVSAKVFDFMKSVGVTDFGIEKEKIRLANLALGIK